MRNAQRVKALTGPSEDEDPSLIIADRLHALAAKAQKVVTDFKEYERRLLIQTDFSSSDPCSASRSLSLELRRCRTLARSYSDSTLDQVRSTAISTRRVSRQKSISPAFTMFCEHLLQENKVRKQEKEIKALKRTVKTSKKARDSAAFQSLCDDLLRSAEMGKKQKEVHKLKEEVDRAKRSQVGVITRAARHMVLDVQKDRMVEEFVKEVLEETKESRQALATQREEHEKEVREMVGVWQKERRQLMREIERLRLAQDAKALEQEISNELEDRLFESVHSVQEIEFDDTYLEEMSVMSSSSTCVGSPSPSPNKHAHFRTCDVAMRKRTLDPLPRRKVDPSQFDGFSFNPLFFGGHSGRASPSVSTKLGRTGDWVELSAPPRLRRNSVTHPTPLRAAWKP